MSSSIAFEHKQHKLRMSTSAREEILHSSASSGSTGLTTPESLTADLPTSTRWRPAFHLMPQEGWINDPCAPGYDPSTGMYYLSFQWNPNGPDWGDIAWGTATSHDLVSWKVIKQPVLLPENDYDSKGVFTGCFVKGQDESLNYIYTSVSALPIHYTLDHPRGCETLSVATSSDMGKTWRKSDLNPILGGEPEGLDVTGWRDPFCGPWPNMSKTLGLDPKETMFGIISGGIRNITPTSFLYRVNPNDFTDWKYIGPIANPGLNFRPSRWSGDLGKNWEVTNFLSLRDGNDPHSISDFLIMGTEGCLEDISKWPPSTASPSRPRRNQLWMSGDLGKDESNGSASMSFNFGGHLDHGCLYAANSFFDPRSQSHIFWGWITEDDLCDDLRHQQGWSGVLSMPRQLYLQTLRNVVGSLVSDLPCITSIKTHSVNGGASTIQTLASGPYQPLVQHLRSAPSVQLSQLGRLCLGASASGVELLPEKGLSKQWELECSFKISQKCSNVGVSINHSRDSERATIMLFEPQLETFTVLRPSFSGRDASLINSSPEVAPHTLFTVSDPSSGEECTETLDIHAWRDNSVLEIFVNGRTAISTRLYAAEETIGVRFFAHDRASTTHGLRTSHTGSTELQFAKVWDGIAS
ncbi:glycosyl hydrolase [Aspergillus pseudotamarii]|uniref:Glycosyl hydrolase n=1 Tax=Aspergillus pseudotamarii TaxID=132259 RepID=A0A5N6SF52_ASPPS|nr:glycosyl hydrolase [Aspergillus pseudotamarii]KAE8132033.1 glycosyl hydrolase [Aspergillus pseudotamarii]